MLEVLEKRHQLDETLIVYLSDHGDMTGDHWLWRKSYAYEASARIPMLARGPGVARGEVSRTPVEIRDVLPALATAAGLGIPAACEGQNLLSARREWIDLEHDVCYDRINHWNALTDGVWKYIYHAFDGREQLFHLAEDRHETKDLAGETASAATLRLWRGRLIEHLAPRGTDWVRNGALVPRPQSIRTSPNYPQPAGQSQ